MESDKEGLVMVEVENDVEEQKIPVSSSTEDSMSSTKKRTNALKASKPGTVVKRRLKKKEKEDASTKIIKYAALLLLVAQMVGLVLLMRYTRTHQRRNQPLYLASTAVFVMEVMKFVICCIVVAIQSGGDLIGEFQEHVVGAPAEVIKLCVPSLLYTVQNNLLYLALTNLDAATYQVCYQLKILTTAVFSAILLHVRTYTDSFVICNSSSHFRLLTVSLATSISRLAQIFSYQMGCISNLDSGCSHCSSIWKWRPKYPKYFIGQAQSIDWSHCCPMCRMHLWLFRSVL